MQVTPQIQLNSKIEAMLDGMDRDSRIKFLYQETHQLIKEAGQCRDTEQFDLYMKRIDNTRIRRDLEIEKKNNPFFM